MIIIIFQEINYIRIKLNRREKSNQIKTISMKQFNSNPDVNIHRGNSYQSFKLNLDNVFDGESKKSISTNMDDEDIIFERPEISKSKPTYSDINDSNKIPDMSIEIGQTQNFSRQTRLSTFQTLINNNQTKLIIVFAILMIIQLIISSFIFFRSVTFSHYKIVTPFVHPVLIIFSFVFKDYSCNFIKNNFN
jgi:hypothetical protein